MTIKVNTHGYEERRISKTIWVTTNDPVNPKLKLTISGNVERFANIIPKGMIRMAGVAGKPIKQTITIAPAKKYQFTITDVTAQKKENIKLSLAEQKPGPGGEISYALTVENLKKEPGRYFDTITIKTTSKIKPLITIRVYGEIRPETEKPKN